MSNIHEAKTLAEYTFRHIRDQNYGCATVLANQALIIDPDCLMAARTVIRLLGIFTSDCLQEATIRAQSCFTRELLILSSNVGHLDQKQVKSKKVIKIIENTCHRMTILTNYLNKIWKCQKSQEHSDYKSYADLLQFIAQNPLSRITKSDLSIDEAFQRLVNMPCIADMIGSMACGRSSKRTEEVISEIQLRFWRLLFYDAWLPPCINVKGFVEAFNEAMRTRLRWSNTPDGIGKTPGVQYDDSSYVPEEEEEDPDSSI